MPSMRAYFDFNEDGVTSKTEIGTSIIKWKSIIKILKHDSAWLFFYDKYTFSTLPIKTIKHETLEYIEQMANKNKIEIKKL